MKPSMKDEFRQLFDVQVTAWVPPRHLQAKFLHTVGDGNCLWRAAAAYANMKWYTLKRRTLQHMRKHATSDVKLQDEIRKLDKRGAWGNSIALMGIASFLQRDICVAAGHALVWMRTPSYTPGHRCIHLLLHQQHFSPLQRSSGHHIFRQCTATTPIDLQTYSFMRLVLTACSFRVVDMVIRFLTAHFRPNIQYKRSSSASTAARDF